MDTIRDIMEEIASLVDDAHTRSLLGERRCALNSIIRASRLYDEFALFISTYEDASVLTGQIKAITQNLCKEATSIEE